MKLKNANRNQLFINFLIFINVSLFSDIKKIDNFSFIIFCDGVKNHRPLDNITFSFLQLTEKKKKPSNNDRINKK